MTLISCKDISRKANGSGELNEIKLDLNTGEICGLIGPNGAGKTTLLKVILGLVPVESGQLIINNKTYQSNREEILHEIGSMLYLPDFWLEMSADEIYQDHCHYSRIDDALSLTDLFTMVELNVSPTLKTNQYSLGMKQRLLLAMALVHEPKILILDEPFNGFDVDGIILMEKIIKKLAHNGVGVLITSHYMGELEGLVDSLIFMKDGYCEPKLEIKEIYKNGAKNLKDYYQLQGKGG